MQTLLKKHLKTYIAVLVMFLSSNYCFSQDPGGNPDGPPPAVPLDDYMHLIIIGAGLVFAAVVLYKRNNRILAK